MGGFTLYNGETRLHVLSGFALESLFTEGKIIFPKITEEEIQDRSKGDGLTKAITIFQTTWFVTQCIARHVQGLVVTELEIITLAFATLNGMMYFFWWNKPMAVRHSVPVFLLQEPWSKRVLKEREPSKHILYHIRPPPHFKLDGPFWSQIFCSCIGFWNSWTRNPSTPQHSVFCWTWKAIFKSLWDLPKNHMVEPVAEFCGVGRRDIFGYPESEKIYTRYAGVMHGHPDFGPHLGILVAVIGNAFGAIHFLAWSSPFPSDIERILWRVCSLIIISVPEIVLLLSIAVELDYPPKRLKQAVKHTALSLTVAGAPLYGIARLVLIFEAFIALRALTPAALVEVEWISFIPHI